MQNDLENLLAQMIAKTAVIGKVLDDAGIGPKTEEELDALVEGELEECRRIVADFHVTEGLVPTHVLDKLVAGLAVVGKHLASLVPGLTARSFAQEIEARIAARKAKESPNVFGMSVEELIAKMKKAMGKDG